MTVEIVHRSGGTAEALRAFHDAQAAEIRALRSRLAQCETALVLYLSEVPDGLDLAAAYIERWIPDDESDRILGTEQTT